MSSGKRFKLLVCGSRDWPEDWLWWVDARMIELSNEHDSVHVIAGGARGVDDRAAECALRCRSSFTLEEFRPDYERFGRRAPLERNIAMLEQAPDLVLAFHHGGSSGTAHTVREARHRGIPVEVYTEPPPPDIAALDMGE